MDQLMNDITKSPEYLAEEKRTQSRLTKLMELTGYKLEEVEELVKTGATDEAILKEVRSQRGEKECPPDCIEAIVKERLEEKELEKVAPKTGYPMLDAHIKGFVPGHLYTLTGQTNIGKSSLACNFAYHVALQGKRVLYLALEPDNTIVDYLASIAKHKWFDEVTPEDYKSIPKNIEVLKKNTINTADKMVKVLRERERYDLVVVDHIGYFITDTNNPYQVQSNVVKTLVSLAKERHTAIVMIAHMRKSIKMKKKTIPTMDDISGSASLKQDATEVLIAIRDEDESDKFGLTYTNSGYLLVAKTKSGKPGSVRITYHDGGASIEENKEWTPTF